MGEPIAEVGYLAGECQFDGESWRKSNLLFGYNAIWDEDLGGEAEGADYTVTSTAVSANEVWVLQAISVSNTFRAATTIYLQVFRASGAHITLEYAATAAQYVPVSVVGTWALGEDDYVRVYLTGSQADDVIVGGLIGYKMKLNM